MLDRTERCKGDRKGPHIIIDADLRADERTDRCKGDGKGPHACMNVAGGRCSTGRTRAKATARVPTLPRISPRLYYVHEAASALLRLFSSFE